MNRNKRLWQPVRELGLMMFNVLQRGGNVTVVLRHNRRRVHYLIVPDRDGPLVLRGNRTYPSESGGAKIAELKRRGE
jgi:hypothetical protein